LYSNWLALYGRTRHWKLFENCRTVLGEFFGRGIYVTMSLSVSSNRRRNNVEKHSCARACVCACEIRRTTATVLSRIRDLRHDMTAPVEGGNRIDSGAGLRCESMDLFRSNRRIMCQTVVTREFVNTHENRRVAVMVVISPIHFCVVDDYLLLLLLLFIIRFILSRPRVEADSVLGIRRRRALLGRTKGENK